MNSPILCEHANEVPVICRCGPGCYCKNLTCRTKTFIVPNPSPDINLLMEALKVAWEALDEYADCDYDEDWRPNRAMRAMVRIEGLTGRTWEEK